MRGTPTPVTVAGIAAGLVLVAAAIAFGRVDAAVAGVLLIVVTALAVPGGEGGRRCTATGARSGAGRP